MEPSNPIFIQLTLGMVFIAILIVSLTIHQGVKKIRRRRNLLRRIKESRDAWTPLPPTDGEEEISETPDGGLLKFIATIGERFSGDDSTTYSNLRLRLLKAGIRRTNASRIFWGAKVLSPPVFVLIFLILRIFLPQLKLLAAPHVLVALIGLGLFGLYLPDIWLTLKTGTRRTKMIEDLPDALDLLVVCVEAGLGLDGAFNRVADELKMTSPELSAEFKLLNLELRAGKVRQEALRDLSARTDIDSLKSLVTLMIQTEMFGTGITKALRVFSDSFRTKRFQKAEEIAAKLPVKMLIPMVFFIFPMFMAVMVGPAAISIWENWLSK